MRTEHWNLGFPRSFSNKLKNLLIALLIIQNFQNFERHKNSIQTISSSTKEYYTLYNKSKFDRSIFASQLAFHLLCSETMYQLWKRMFLSTFNICSIHVVTSVLQPIHHSDSYLLCFSPENEYNTFESVKVHANTISLIFLHRLRLLQWNWIVLFFSLDWCFQHRQFSLWRRMRIMYVSLYFSFFSFPFCHTFSFVFWPHSLSIGYKL